MNDVLGMMKSPPSHGLYRVWRSEKRFKNIVNGLKKEFANYIARNIVFDNEVGFYSDGDEGPVTRGLDRKILYMMEAISYPPALLKRIGSAMATCLNSQENNQSISNYLGHLIWCILVLYFPLKFGRNSRQRKVFVDVCRQTIGVKGGNEFIIGYLEKSVHIVRGNLMPQKKLDEDFEKKYYKQRLETVSQFFSYGAFDHIQDLYRQTLATILNTEIQRLATSENDLNPVDIMTGVNFLANGYTFIYRADDTLGAMAI